MFKERPDHHDAELVLKLYDLRREAVMRESRNNILRQFWPKNYEEFIAVTQLEHPLNAAWRQTTSDWEMAYGMAKHGIVNPDYLAENSGEGMFIFARVHPYLAQFRKDVSPTAFQNAEWIATNCETGKRMFAFMQGRVKKWLESKK